MPASNTHHAAGQSSFHLNGSTLFRWAALAALASFTGCTASSPPSRSEPPVETPIVGVGAQYDSTHVYVAPADLDSFVASFTAAFGGTNSPAATMSVTPTPSETVFRAVSTPAGLLSAFAFKSPVPYPFGAERTGYLVSNMDDAIRAARACGADVIVEPFNDPIGRDAIIQWPGGVYMQLYWHTSAPHNPPLTAIPENRIYLSNDKAGEFIEDFLNFSHGSITADDAKAPGVEIGSPATTYRRVRIESTFGKMTLLITAGDLPYPYGRETTGYEVNDLAATLEKAKLPAPQSSLPPTKQTPAPPPSFNSPEATSLKSTRPFANSTRQEHNFFFSETLTRIGSQFPSRWVRPPASDFSIAAQSSHDFHVKGENAKTKETGRGSGRADGGDPIVRVGGLVGGSARRKSAAATLRVSLVMCPGPSYVKLLLNAARVVLVSPVTFPSAS